VTDCLSCGMDIDSCNHSRDHSNNIPCCAHCDHSPRPEERCAYVYAEGNLCPFPKEMHTGSLNDIWVENMLLVSETSPSHPFHPPRSARESTAGQVNQGPSGGEEPARGESTGLKVPQAPAENARAETPLYVSWDELSELRQTAAIIPYNTAAYLKLYEGIWKLHRYEVVPRENIEALAKEWEAAAAASLDLSKVPYMPIGQIVGTPINMLYTEAAARRLREILEGP